MGYNVLGPLEVLHDGAPVRVDGPIQRALLAVLIIHANEVVSSERLLDLVWGNSGGDGGDGKLRFQISKLRSVLDADPEPNADRAVVTVSPGYMLAVAERDIDAARFSHLVQDARRVGDSDPDEALTLLDESLDLWRGRPYAEFEYEEWAQSEIRRLSDLRLGAMEDRFDALLSLGRSKEAIGDLHALVAENPRRERLRGALMLALYRAGRQAEALAAYQDLRRELGEGLGIDPSIELQNLEERMLLHDPSLESRREWAGDRLRGYVLSGQIGEGAHGVVYSAAQSGIGREVAIKTIRSDLANDVDFVRRFEAEAQIIASLEHPHIVSLFDFWRDPDGAYLVMPYLRGGSLATRLGVQQMDSVAVMELANQLGDALVYAHRRGISHRDVTPDNVLLDEDGNLYLADFGVSALLGTVGAAASSSPGYLPPEVLSDGEASPASDVFSLGVLCHAALTGVLPTAGGQTLPVSSVRQGLPVGVDDVVAKATAFDVADRYETVEEFVEKLDFALGGAAPTVEGTGENLRNPFKGLRAFVETDADDFHGRDASTDELVRALDQHRLIGVVGPSGCGKSSVVRAGLVPRLRSGEISGSEEWLVTDMYPGSRPFNELEQALLQVAVSRPEGLAEALISGADEWQQVSEIMFPDDAEVLLIVDQFEELFTLTVDPVVRRRFLETLVVLASDPRNRVRVIVTMRADFYDRPLGHPAFGDLLRTGLVSLTMPDKASLTDAIVGPAKGVGLSLEEGLAESVVKDVVDQPGGLPLMEYALTEMFIHRIGPRLTVENYYRTGGVLGALGSRAEDLYATSDDKGKVATRQVFLHLVAVEEGVADARRRIPALEVAKLGIESETLEDVLDKYGSHRLLTFDSDPNTRAPTIEVAHEALLSHWERLRVWIEERRDDLVLDRHLTGAMVEWEDTGCDDAYLLVTGRLEHYERFADSTDLALTDGERGYLAASRTHVEAERARRRRLRRSILVGVVAAAIIATTLAIVAFASKSQADEASTAARQNAQTAMEETERADAASADAQRQTQLAEINASEAVENAAMAQARELAAEAMLTLDTDAELAILLALEAVRIEIEGEPLKEAEEVLHQAVIASRARLRTPGDSRVGTDASGEHLVSRDREGSVTVYNARTGEAQTVLPFAGSFDDFHLDFAMAISPDGRLIATGRTDGTITIWDSDTGQELATTNDRQEFWTDAEAGTFAIAYGYGDVETGPIPFDANAQEIESAVEALPGVTNVSVEGAGTRFDPWILTPMSLETSYTDRLIPNAEKLPPVEAMIEITGRGNAFTVAVLAGGGAFTLTVDETTRPIRFDITNDDLEAILELLPEVKDVTIHGRGTVDEPWRMTFDDWNPSGTGVLMGDPGELEPKPSRVLMSGRGHDNPNENGIAVDGINMVQFRPDGAVLASWGWDETIRMWDVRDLSQIVEIAAPILPFRAVGMDFSDDGSMIAAPVGVVTVWDADTGEVLKEFGDAGNTYSDVAFFPGGNRLAVTQGDPDWALSVWNINTATGHFIPGGGAWLRAVDVSSDGTLIVAGDDGGTVTVSESTEMGERPLYSFSAHSGRMMDLTFAGTGHTLVSVSDKEARIWDLGISGSRELLTLRGSSYGLGAVSYSPDGSLIAHSTAMPDDEMGFASAVAVVDSETGELIHLLGTFVESTQKIAFSPDGAQVAVAGTHVTGRLKGDAVQVWDASSGSLLAVPEGAEYPSGASSVAYSPDGVLLAAVVDEREILIWDTASFESVLSLASKDSEADLRELSFSPDGQQLAVRGTMFGVDVVDTYDVATGELLTTCCEHVWWIWSASVAYSPDGEHLVTSGIDVDTEEGTVIVWDAATGEEAATLYGHSTAVFDAVFSPDGTLIASSGGAVRLWDVGTSREIVALEQPGESVGAIFNVAFSPDGRRVVSIADTVGEMRVWVIDIDDLIKIAENRLTRGFTKAECAAYGIQPCPTHP